MMLLVESFNNTKNNHDHHRRHDNDRHRRRSPLSSSLKDPRLVVFSFLLLLLLLATENGIKGAEVSGETTAAKTADADGLEIGEEEPVPIGSSSLKDHQQPNPTQQQQLQQQQPTTTTTTTTTPDEQQQATTTIPEGSNNADGGASAEASSSSTAETAVNTTSSPPPPPPAAATTESTAASADSSNKTSESQSSQQQEPIQSGPFVELFGPQLLSLDMVDEKHAQLLAHYTNDALRNKKVVGVYFSADWCGPCRKFTPELVSFYKKMNERRGHKNEFEIVWVSRCRDVNSYGQYFAHMGGWYALPPEAAMGAVGQMLSNKYKIKSIPGLVLLDDLGNVITTDARNKIPKDKAGIGFPWRNPLSNLYVTIVPKTVRYVIKSQIDTAKNQAIGRVKRILGLQKQKPQQQQQQQQMQR